MNIYITLYFILFFCLFLNNFCYVYIFSFEIVTEYRDTFSMETPVTAEPCF